LELVKGGGLVERGATLSVGLSLWFVRTCLFDEKRLDYEANTVKGGQLVGNGER